MTKLGIIIIFSTLAFGKEMASDFTVNAHCGGSYLQPFTATGTATFNKQSKTFFIRLSCQYIDVCSSFTMTCNDKNFCSTPVPDDRGNYADAQISDDEKGFFFGYKSGGKYLATCTNP